MHCLGKQRLKEGGQSLFGADIEDGCERQEEMLLPRAEHTLGKAEFSS